MPRTKSVKFLSNIRSKLPLTFLSAISYALKSLTVQNIMLYVFLVTLQVYLYYAVLNAFNKYLKKNKKMNKKQFIWLLIISLDF